MAELDPPDYDRCQAEVVQRTPFALGGTHKRTRCSEIPVCVAVENQPGKDGKVGSMSLCHACMRQMIKQLGPDYCRFDWLTA